MKYMNCSFGEGYVKFIGEMKFMIQYCRGRGWGYVICRGGKVTGGEFRSSWSATDAMRAADRHTNQTRSAEALERLVVLIEADFRRNDIAFVRAVAEAKAILEREGMDYRKSVAMMMGVEPANFMERNSN